MTSDHVLVETWLLVNGRQNGETANKLVERIGGGLARVEPAGLADLQVAAEIRRAFADQNFSIVDRTSWAIMERLGLRQAITFDIDYSVYRFGPLRDQALTVHT